MGQVERQKGQMGLMSEALRNFTGFSIITLLFTLGSFALIARNHTVSGSARRAFLICFGSLFFIALFDWIDYAFGMHHPEFRWFYTVTTALTFAVAPALPALIAKTIFPNQYYRYVRALIVAQALLELATVFGGFVFYVDANGVYVRGQFYPVYMATYTVSALYLSYWSIRAGATYQSTNVSSILIILTMLVVGVAIQVFDSSIRTTWPAVAMTVILYYLFYADMILSTDALTQLLNRRSYHEFLARPTLPCEVIVLDVDNFKHINDTYGHAYGDVCLQTEAKLIRRAFAGTGLCYRSGGDEFTVMMTKRLDDVDATVGTLQQLVSKEQEKEPRLAGLSIGHARAELGCKDLKAVIEQADQRMYEDKRARKAGR